MDMTMAMAMVMAIAKKQQIHFGCWRERELRHKSGCCLLFWVWGRYAVCPMSVLYVTRSTLALYGYGPLAFSETYKRSMSLN